VIPVKATTLPPTTPAPKADCEAQADIVFLLDSSGSVGSANFQKMKAFVHDMMTSFNIGPNAVQVRPTYTAYSRLGIELPIT